MSRLLWQRKVTSILFKPMLFESVLHYVTSVYKASLFHSPAMCSAVCNRIWYFASQYSPGDKPADLNPKVSTRSRWRGKQRMPYVLLALASEHPPASQDVTTFVSQTSTHWEPGSLEAYGLRTPWGLGHEAFMAPLSCHSSAASRLRTIFFFLLVLNGSICAKHGSSVPSLVSAHQLVDNHSFLFFSLF